MKNQPSSFLFYTAALFSGIFPLNAGEPGSAPRSLAPFSEEVLISGTMLPADGLGNLKEERTRPAGTKLNFKFDIDYFKDVPAFNRALLESAFRTDGNTSDPFTAIENFILSTEKAHAEPSGIAGEYSFFVSIKAAPQVGNTVSVLVSRYEDTGGAHGNNTFSCATFDLSEKKQIFLKDIFEESARPLLKNLLRKNDPRRKSAGFSYAEGDGEIPLSPYATENFLMLPDGIMFIYPPYELDCYAAGTIRIFIPAAEIRALLKK